MTTAALRARLARWRRRERIRKLLHTSAQADLVDARASGEDAATVARLEARRDLRSRQLREAREQVARREKQLTERRRRKPRIVTARQLGLSFQDLFGALGPETNVTGHHTAGPTDGSAAAAIALDRRYHGEHAAKGWGGIGYHFNIARDGTIICLRPTRLKGAHVGLHNTENAGVMFHGTTGDTPTPEQHESYRWLLAHAHTRTLPKAHRTDRDLRKAARRGHNDWPGHSTNACPGTHKPMILQGG